MGAVAFGAAKIAIPQGVYAGYARGADFETMVKTVINQPKVQAALASAPEDVFVSVSTATSGPAIGVGYNGVVYGSEFLSEADLRPAGWWGGDPVKRRAEGLIRLLGVSLAQREKLSARLDAGLPEA